MKHPLFECLGEKYPIHLEEQFDRILTRIEFLWDTPEIHDYFSDLLIDKRGGRQGFPPKVLADIITLREFRDLETFRQAERREHAVRELAQRGIKVDQSSFLAAMRAGDRELVDLFVRAKINIHGIDIDGASPLLFALKRGFTVIASILVNAGADVNERDHLGLTPLLVACAKPTEGYRSIAEALILRGAHVNVRDPLGNTPLILALSGGVTDIALLLVEHGADVFASTRKGDTALSLARKPGTPAADRIVELMLDKGATR